MQHPTVCTLVACLLGTSGLEIFPTAHAETDVYLLDVPDYDWYAGCFGTACGNLAGYWDRHGFPGFYTGPTGHGLAPLDSFGKNRGVRSMWATKAGLDGRPADQPGHIDDYWAFYNDINFSYEDPAPDPFTLAGRAEHGADCIGDFIGLSQRKWKNLAGECDGNIDAYSFVFWDSSGERRVNYTPPHQEGRATPDIPSGLRAWTRSRESAADVFSQLADVNPDTPAGRGFTFEHLKAEIDAGYPVLIYLQPPSTYFRTFDGERLNPAIHGMLAYGYYLADDGTVLVRLRSSWADGDHFFRSWNTQAWVLENDLHVRGVISYHPLPRVTRVVREARQITIDWEGPASRLRDAVNGGTRDLHAYVVERSATLNPADFTPLGPPVMGSTATFPDCCEGTAFFRVRLVAP